MSFTLTDRGYSNDEVGELAVISIASFTYNGKPRLGIYLGEDSRPGTDNRMYYTLDGLRSFKRTNIEDEVVVSRIEAPSVSLTPSDTNIEELI